MKPNVRARATSFTYECSAKSMTTCRFSDPNTGCGKSIVKSSLKPSNGSKRAHLSPSRTSTDSRMRMYCLRASCSTMPADCSRKTNGAALPSMIGSSGPATSMCMLSMPRPAHADSTCSTVEIDTPSCFSDVERRVSPTWSASAGIDTDCARSTRWKTIPVSGAAGRMTRSTRAPVCTPTPVVLLADLSVRCFSITRTAVLFRVASRA